MQITRPWHKYTKQVKWLSVYLSAFLSFSLPPPPPRVPVLERALVQRGCLFKFLTSPVRHVFVSLKPSSVLGVNASPKNGNFGNQQEAAGSADCSTSCIWRMFWVGRNDVIASQVAMNRTVEEIYCL